MICHIFLIFDLLILGQAILLWQSKPIWWQLWLIWTYFLTFAPILSYSINQIALTFWTKVNFLTNLILLFDSLTKLVLLITKLSFKRYTVPQYDLNHEDENRNVRILTTFYPNEQPSVLSQEDEGFIRLSSDVTLSCALKNWRLIKNPRIESEFAQGRNEDRVSRVVRCETYGMAT